MALRRKRGFRGISSPAKGRAPVFHGPLVRLVPDVSVGLARPIRGLTRKSDVHVIVPGGGLSADGTQWIACRSGFFLPVKVLSKLFRRLFVEGLIRLYKAGKLHFFGDLAKLADPGVFAAHLAPLRKINWVVYAKPPFGGPEAVLAYLSRYTHRVAI